MTKIKFCGLTRPEDIAAANRLRPEYIGFVFAKKSKRYVSGACAAKLKERLAPGIIAVGVFVNEAEEAIAALATGGVIEAIQLHGEEDAAYIARLRRLTTRPIIKAFRVKDHDDIKKARESCADFVLLDAGMGDGVTFDWTLIKDVERPYFLAGGLTAQKVGEAVRLLSPFAVDVSSGIETDGKKDEKKMEAFKASVRREDEA